MMGYAANYARNLISVALGRQPARRPAGGPARPLLFSYYVTHRCPLRCTYCSDGDGRPFPEKSVPELGGERVQELLAILRRAADALDVTGGEPLVRDDLEEILGYAQALGFRVVLNTKGIGLAQRPRLMALTDVLVLSLDALDATVLAGIMNSSCAAAEEVLDAVQFAMATRRQTRTKVVLSAVATPGNLSEVARVLHFAMEHGLGFHLAPWLTGTTVHPELRDRPEYRALLDEVMRAKSARGRVLGIAPYLRGIRDFASFRCHPLLMPTIRPDGALYYPCLESGRAEVDLLEAGSYTAAWRAARERGGALPSCRDRCHIFCHMALSLLQRHPLAALAELGHWRD